jgi:hypothetical protein
MLKLRGWGKKLALPPGGGAPETGDAGVKSRRKTTGFFPKTVALTKSILVPQNTGMIHRKYLDSFVKEIKGTHDACTHLSRHLQIQGLFCC